MSSGTAVVSVAAAAEAVVLSSGTVSVRGCPHKGSSISLKRGKE